MQKGELGSPFCRLSLTRPLTGVLADRKSIRKMHHDDGFSLGKV